MENGVFGKFARSGAGKHVLAEKTTFGEFCDAVIALGMRNKTTDAGVY
jgi:hypothetical protein